MRLLVLTIMMLGLSACSLEGQITDMTQRNIITNFGELTGFISGSQQNAVTPEGYKVSASVGAAFSGNTDTLTTNNAYIVHSNVQGNISSESVIVTAE